MKKNTKTQPSGLIREVTIPQAIPFLGLAVRRNRQHLEVFIKTAPSRRWRLQLRGLIANLPTALPRG